VVVAVVVEAGIAAAAGEDIAAVAAVEEGSIDLAMGKHLLEAVEGGTAEPEGDIPAAAAGIVLEGDKQLLAEEIAAVAGEGIAVVAGEGIAVVAVELRHLLLQVSGWCTSHTLFC